jgi:hypothetical protein
MRTPFGISKQNLLYWTEQQLHKQTLDDNTLLNGSLKQTDQYSKLTSVCECAKIQYIMSWIDWELTVHVFNKMAAQCTKQDRQTDKKDILWNVSKTPHFRRRMTIGFQSHNHAWFFPSVFSWVQDTYKSSPNNQRVNQLNCEVTKITNGY